MTRARVGGGTGAFFRFDHLFRRWKMQAFVRLDLIQRQLKKWKISAHTYVLFAITIGLSNVLYSILSQDFILADHEASRVVGKEFMAKAHAEKEHDSRLQDARYTRHNDMKEGEFPDSDAPLLMQFEVCEGATNQRISLVSGLLIAHLMNASAVLPMFHSSIFAGQSRTLNMDRIYNVSRLKTGLHGFVDISPHPHGHDSHKFAKSYINIGAHNTMKSQKEWRALAREARMEGRNLIQLDCAFFSISLDDEIAGEFWKIDRNLHFSDEIVDTADLILDKLAIGRDFIALHIRMEQDWIDHCERWENMNDGIIRDNCMTNTDKLHNVFTINGLQKGDTVYVAGGYTQAELEKSPNFDIIRNDYNLVMKSDAVSDGTMVPNAKNRDILALVDFEICRRARVFIGNSVSTFSAMLILSRKQEGIPHIHYNGGNIPLQDFIPVHHNSKQDEQQNNRLKWVFTLTLNKFAKRAYHSMAKVAVQSAQKTQNMDPICILNPNDMLPEVQHEDARVLVEWLEQKGVRILWHQPDWAWKIHELVRSGGAKKNEKWSPLFKSSEAMVSTFMRIDIPLMGFTDDYVLYTDVDIMFTSRIGLDTFPYLPDYLMAGTEFSKVNEGYANAGILLYNIQGMRRTYSDFLNYAFSDKNLLEEGLHYGWYGPGDQGAYNSYYGLVLDTLDVVEAASFNWKPYWEPNSMFDDDDDDDVEIVHWHGPKPVDYHAYFQHGIVINKRYENILRTCNSSFELCSRWHREWVSHARDLNLLGEIEASISLKIREAFEHF